MSQKRKGDGSSGESKRPRPSVGPPARRSGLITGSNVFTFSDYSSGKRMRATQVPIEDEGNKERPPPEPTQPTRAPQSLNAQELNRPIKTSAGGDHHHGSNIDAPQPQVLTKVKQNRNFKNWNKLLEWLPYRSEFLDELLRHDGHGDYLGITSCHLCDEKDCKLYKCLDCWDGSLLSCSHCALNTHRNLPLHRIEEWNSRFFEKTTLSHLGLRLQLGHGGGTCANPLPGPKGFTIFDLSGVHPVNLDYCNCLPLAIDRKTQLLRSRLFPATLSRPQTAFTFDMLDHFHQLSLQGKVTLYDYYQTIVKRSDFLQLSTVPSRCNDFHRASRLWRVLLMLKRAGRGNVRNGVEETAEGDLAIECPACPHPDKNLPVRWKEAGPLLFLYTLFIAVDANFKLKGKDRGISDLELLPGKAYFVEESKYQSHLINYVDESEINTCLSEHDAVVRAAVRCTPGYNVTGAALVVCSRHGLVRPNGAGDLQKGERYCNIDYVIFSALAGIALMHIVITYDIACQWGKNFIQRLGKLPDDLRLDMRNTKVTPLIPSWHINGHGPDCQVNYALIYTPGCARTCGDEIEGSFSETNILGASVREMAPGQLLAKKFREAAEMRAQQEHAFNNLCLTFTPDKIVRWMQMIMNWEKDPKKHPNPYAEVKLETTMQDVRLQLAQEDLRNEAAGVAAAHTTSMTTCLVVALDLEEQQYATIPSKLICDSPKILRRALKHDLQNSRLSTSKQKADLQEKRNGMHRRISRWREVQIVYSPCVVPLLPSLSAGEDSGGGDGLKPEDIPLYLPSDLTPALRQTIPTMTLKECRLREAQADDALSEIRLGRRILTGLTQFKKLHLAGEGNKPNTRVRSLYNRIQSKITKAANRYRRAREALVTMNPGGQWEHRLKTLHPGDIRGPGREVGEGSGGRFIPSWIWQVPRVRQEGDSALAEEELDESLRVEWAKGRARLNRWNEEYLLVQEEMRRTIVYLRWKAAWWEERGHLDAFKPNDTMHGIWAYAYKQAEFCRRLSDKFSQEWARLLRKHGEFPLWMPWAGYETEHNDVANDVATGELGGEASNDADADDDGGGDDERDPDLGDEVDHDEAAQVEGAFEFELDD